MPKLPPLFCRKIFRFFIPEYDWVYFFGGIDEVYQGMVQTRGKWIADTWYWIQLGKSLPRMLLNELGGGLAMIRNLIKIAMRGIRRQKGFSALNIIGLAVGLAVCIMIFFWVHHELSYDRFHKNGKQIYRAIEHEELSNGVVLSYSQQAPALAPILKTNYPEISAVTRYRSWGNRLIQFEERRFYERYVSFADAEFLTMFTFRLKAGDPASALSSPNSIVLTERMAEKYFDKSNAMGKILRFDNQFEYVVAGILENPPTNSHLHFDFLLPFESIDNFGQDTEGWGSFYLDTYVMLAPGTDYREFNKKIENVISENSDGDSFVVDLQPLHRIRLYSNAILTPQVDGDIKYVVIFSLIAVFILLNACINFMNLTTARSSRRAKEIGLRKVVGARRKQLVNQFFGESILMAILALVIAVGLVILLLPVFSRLSGKELSWQLFGNWHVILALFGITLFAGVVSGIYPALFLSGFQPVAALRKTFTSGTRGAAFRRILVIFQFVMTSVLIIGMFVVFRQLNFLRRQNMGFDKDQVVCVRLPGNSAQKIDTLKASYKQLPSVVSTASADSLPGRRRALLTLTEWEGRDSDDRIEMGLFYVDDEFLSTFKLEMAEGRFFSREFPTDIGEGVVVNQAAIDAMGMENPVGKRVLRAKIIGVIKDFHMRSLHYKVAPLALVWQPRRVNTLFLKIASSDIPQTLSSLESTWASVVTDYPFEYEFLDENLETLYQGDRRIGDLINASALLALFVACLGLLGLASFVAEQRTKEIGIRKVLGASLFGILSLLTRDFLKWVLIANVIAAPLAGYAMTMYLRSYAYHTNLTPLSFLLPLIMTLVISLLTVCWQVLRAAGADPVKSLKYE